MNDQTQDIQQEALDLLYEAQEKLQEAYEALQAYDRLTHDRHTKAYITDRLRIMIDGEHGFLTNDTNLGKVIDSVCDGNPGPW